MSAGLEPNPAGFTAYEARLVLRYSTGLISYNELANLLQHNEVLNEVTAPSDFWAKNDNDGFNFRRGGFDLLTTSSFLDKSYCLKFADNIILYVGNNGLYSGMSSLDIAQECFAHAVGKLALYLPSRVHIYDDTFKSTVRIDIDGIEWRTPQFKQT